MAYVSAYAHHTVASIPRDVWDDVWFAFQSWKGYLQSFPGLQLLRLAARGLENGDVRFYVITNWDDPEQVDEWAKSEWSAGRLLAKFDPPAYDIETDMLEILS